MIPTAVIVIAIVGNLASMGQKIVVEKDCIIVVAGSDENKLATMNAIFRTIDLTALVLSSTFAGLIFDFTSHEVTAAVIGCWNLMSVLIEYRLLVVVFKKFKELSRDRKVDES